MEPCSAAGGRTVRDTAADEYVTLRITTNRTRGSRHDTMGVTETEAGTGTWRSWSVSLQCARGSAGQCDSRCTQKATAGPLSAHTARILARRSGHPVAYASQNGFSAAATALGRANAAVPRSPTRGRLIDTACCRRRKSIGPQPYPNSVAVFREATKRGGEREVERAGQDGAATSELNRFQTGH